MMNVFPAVTEITTGQESPQTADAGGVNDDLLVGPAGIEPTTSTV